MFCICSRPDATSPDDPWINPNCPAHGRYSVGNIWRQPQRDRELRIAFFVLGLVLSVWVLLAYLGFLAP